MQKPMTDSRLAELRKLVDGFPPVGMVQSRYVRELIREIDRLRAIIPRTADGKQAHHGMRVWSPGEREADYGTVTFHVCEEGGFTSIKSCYSTYAAALAAKGDPK